MLIAMAAGDLPSTVRTVLVQFSTVLHEPQGTNELSQRVVPAVPSFLDLTQKRARSSGRRARFEDRLAKQLFPLGVPCLGIKGRLLRYLRDTKTTSGTDPDKNYCVTSSLSCFYCTFPVVYGAICKVDRDSITKLKIQLGTRNNEQSPKQSTQDLEGL